MLCRRCLRTTLQLGRSANLQAEPRASWKVAANPSGARSYSRSFPEAALPNRSWTAAGLSPRKRPSAPSLSGRVRHPTSWQTRNVVTLAKRPEEPEEPDVFTSGEPTVILTERAEQKLKSVAEAEQNPNLALRIAVEPGGCHGYQYKMELTDEAEEDDFHFKAADGVTLFIDSVSLNLVKGSTIDYVTELIGSQFAIKENPQAKGSGCGCGVSWEPAI